ncbi:hypothetical protein Q7P37_007788 [Cladosporium fusiforme]
MATEHQPQQSPPANGGLKRRQSEQSEAPEQESKRLRTSPDKSSLDPEAAAPSAETEVTRRESTDKTSEPRDARRKSSAISEKDRSRRLFGGLLGSLSQKGDSRTTKRRQEIESRKKAELQQQDDQNLEDKQKRLEQLSEKRRRVKKRMDEETMRNRHRNIVHSAHFLHTTAQPRLLYKPWELRSEEEDRTDDQIYEAKAQIERELANAEKTPTRKPDTLKHASPERTTTDTPQEDPTSKTNLTTNDAVQEPHTEATGESAAIPTGNGHDESSLPKDEGENAAHPDSPTNGETQSEEVGDSAAKAATVQHDEHDDHVVEGEEDTVIY